MTFKLKKYIKKSFSVAAGFFWYHSSFNTLRQVKILSDEAAIKKIVQNQSSVSRFGDGEFAIAHNLLSNFYQKNDSQLATKLRMVFKNPGDNVLIGVPMAIKSMDGLKLYARAFWYAHIFENRQAWGQCLDYTRQYINTNITRPYMDYRRRDFAKYFHNLQKIWNNREVCIIEGEKTRFGVGNDFLANAHRVERIIAPSKNAFDKYDDILNTVLAKISNKDELILVALGPTATVLVNDLSAKGYQAVDIGHADIEYEWFTKNAKKKVVIAGKYTNESKIKYIDGEFGSSLFAYKNSIIAKV